MLLVLKKQTDPIKIKGEDNALSPIKERESAVKGSKGEGVLVTATNIKW